MCKKGFYFIMGYRLQVVSSDRCRNGDDRHNSNTQYSIGGCSFHLCL
jgi:hypothetical protein